jgi:hypothetical protein
MAETRVRRWIPAVLALAFGAGLLLRPGSAHSQMLQMQLQVLSQFQTLADLLANQAGQLQGQLDRARAARNQTLSQAYSQALELSSQGYQTVLAGVSDLGSTVMSVAHNLSSTTAATRAMSCPVFVDQGVLIGEDSCVWMSVTGQKTRQFAIDSNAVAYDIGGQKEVMPEWFIGGALGTGSSWRQTDNDFSSVGQTFEGSLAVKHTMGPWLVAGGIAATTSATHMARLATGPTPVVQSDSSVFHGVGDLRVTYDFAFDG